MSKGLPPQGSGKRNTATPSSSGMVIILDEPRMRSQEERLRTFRDWPSDAPVTAVDLAKAGFYFVGPRDEVQCFCCGGVLRHWLRGDTPLAEHRRHFPTCSFVLGRNVGNIQYLGTRGPSDDVDGQLLSQLQRMTVDHQAAYPDLEAEESRMTTFHNWPTGSSVPPEVLARAGFFYTGYGDNVKCFYCDGGLRHWEDGDDPWQEHAKWFPRCEFLLQARGPEYVSNIQDSHFGISETVSGSQISTARDLNSGHGTRYTSVSNLVAEVLQAEEEDRRLSEQTRDPVVTQGHSSGWDQIWTLTGDKAGELSPEEQLRQLQDERTCKICLDKLVSIVFIPCGHLVACTDCAASLQRCPICRALIRGSVRAFLS